MEHFPTHVQLQRDDNEKRVSRLYVVVEKRVQPEINTRHYSNGLSFAATFLPFFLTGVINKGGKHLSAVFYEHRSWISYQAAWFVPSQSAFEDESVQPVISLEIFFFLNINIHRQVRSSEP